MVRYHRADDVRTIAIDNRDQANALTEELLGQLIDAFTEASADEVLRAVLITSAGGRGPLPGWTRHGSSTHSSLST